MMGCIASLKNSYSVKNSYKVSKIVTTWQRLFLKLFTTVQASMCRPM